MPRLRRLKVSKTQEQKGFTLLEVMAVVAIIGIMSSIALVFLNKGRTRQEVELAAREFDAAIRQAQSYAMTGKVFNGIPCTYQLVMTSSTRYAISYQSKVNNDCPANLTSNLSQAQSFDLPNGVQFEANSWANGQIVFSLPSGSGTETNVSFVTLKKGNESQKVCIPNVSGTFSNLTC